MAMLGSALVKMQEATIYHNTRYHSKSIGTPVVHSGHRHSAKAITADLHTS